MVPRLRIACALLLCLAPACGSPPPPNIVLIVVDALRADRLGVYGNPRGLSPFLDELAARSVVFHRAYAVSSWTLPSVASILTSRFPSQHGVTSFAAQLPAGEVTLDQVLRAAGYLSAAFTANLMTHRLVTSFDHREQLLRSDTSEREIPGRGVELNRQVARWLTRIRESGEPARPVFIYLHYMETHTPYAPPEAFLAKTQRGDPPDVGFAEATIGVGNGLGIGDEARPAVEAVYDAEVLAVDAAVRDLLATLDRMQMGGNTLIVLTSDHGEAFREHGFWSHGINLYNEILQVPLIVHVPGAETRVDVDAVVSLADLAPTLAELAGLPVPAPFEGDSFARLLVARRSWSPLGLLMRWRAQRRTAYSEANVSEEDRRLLRALISGHMKFIVHPDGTSELFDLAADPGEKTPQPLAEGESLARMLDARSARLLRRASARETTPLDEATRQRLKALGYVAGEARPQPP